jgi:hypothetical protein
MNSTCIHYGGTRPKYIQVQVCRFAQSHLDNGENTRDTYTSNKIPITRYSAMGKNGSLSWLHRQGRCGLGTGWLNPNIRRLCMGKI